MTDSLFTAGRLFLQQRAEWAEILVDFEVRNAYEILDSTKRRCGHLLEEPGRVGAALQRLLLRTRRGFTAHVLNAEHKRMLRLWRSFSFFFSELHVQEPDGREIGSVRRRFSVLHNAYDLRDGTGRVFARVRGARWHPWTFPVLSSQAPRDEVACVRKKWSGAMRELFSNADTFLIEFKGASLTHDQRWVIFAAAVSVDFDFFEAQRKLR